MNQAPRETSPAREEPPLKSGRALLFQPFSVFYAIRDWGEPFWKQSLGLLFVPALIAIVAIEYLARAPATAIWQSVIGLSVGYTVLILVTYRKRPE